MPRPRSPKSVDKAKNNPITRAELIRYMAIDSCFSNHAKICTKDDLCTAAEDYLNEFFPSRKRVEGRISERMIWEDITRMQYKWGFKLNKTPSDRARLDDDGRLIDGSKMSATNYHYEDPDFCIRRAPLIAAEEPWLEEFRFLAHYFREKPDFGWITELYIRLDDDRREGMNTVVPDMRSEYYLKGFREFFYYLYDAIQCRRVQKIDYRTFDGKEETWTISPYFLKEYNNRWFLFGYNHARNQLTNAPLDRIQRAEAIEEDYIKPDEVDELKELTIFDDYFEDVIGVTIPKDGEVETVKLKFTDRRFHTVTTKPLHPSQRNYEKEKTVTINVKKNRELIQTILSFGKDVEVLEPAGLRNEIKGIVKDMYGLYGE